MPLTIGFFKCSNCFLFLAGKVDSLLANKAKLEGELALARGSVREHAHGHAHGHEQARSNATADADADAGAGAITDANSSTDADAGAGYMHVQSNDDHGSRQDTAAMRSGGAPAVGGGTKTPSSSWEEDQGHDDTLLEAQRLIEVTPKLLGS